VKLRWDLVAIAYALLALVGAGLSIVLNGPNPFQHPAANLTLGLMERHGLSCGLGLALGVFVVATTRLTVTHFGWARRLHTELRPVAVGMGGPTILVVAALSSLGEELVFRSLLTPLLGVWLQGVLFGFLHQIRGSSRWFWMGWAACVGLALGALYWLTGSLAGPLVAHGFINAVNLLYLRDHSLGVSDPPLGGLLAGQVTEESSAGEG